MTFVTCLVSLSLAQPIVRELDPGERSSDFQLVAANQTSVWFTAGEGSSLRRGGTRVFRFDRDAGQLESAISGAEWPGVGAFSPSGLQGYGRGQTLMTPLGEFGSLGPQRRWTSLSAPTQLVVAGEMVLLLQGQTLSLSLRPGQVRPLDAPRPRGLVASTSDGRIGWFSSPTLAVIVKPDGTVAQRAQTFAGAAGSTFLFVQGETLSNEAGERLAAVLPTRREPQLEGGWFSARWFLGQSGHPVITDGTPGGTVTLLGRNEDLAQVTGSFATFRVDGGLMVETFEGTRSVAPAFTGLELSDRLLQRNVELYADGGLVRRTDVHDCEWRPVDPRSDELWCSHAGALWARATADAPQRSVFAGSLGRAAEYSTVQSPLDGTPLVFDAPTALWTDGVVTQRLPLRDPVVGLSENHVVFDGASTSIFDPVTGTQRALPVVWRPFVSYRALFAQTAGARGHCEVRRVDLTTGSLDEVVRFDGAAACLTRVIDSPTELEAQTLQGVFFWDPLRRQFSSNSPRRVSKSGTVMLRGAQFSESLKTALLVGNARSLDPGGVLTPFGNLLESPGQLELFLTDGSITTTPAPLSHATWTEQGLWAVSAEGIVFSDGGRFSRVVPAEPIDGAHASFAVGRSLLFEFSTEVVALRPDGSLMRRSFVRAERPFLMFGTRWYALDDGTHGVEPWWFDGTSFQLVDLMPGRRSSHPHFLGSAHGRLVLEADRPDGSIGLLSIEFQPPIAEPPALSPLPEERSCGCTSALTPVLLCGVALLARRRRRSSFEIGRVGVTRTWASPRTS